MSRSEVAEHVIVNANSATKPHVGQIASAKTIQMARAADRFDSSKQPQGHENLRIDSIASDATFDGLNFLIQRLQVERIDIRPDGPDAMIPGNQLVQRRIAPLDLLPLRPLDSNLPHREICFCG